MPPQGGAQLIMCAELMRYAFRKTQLTKCALPKSSTGNTHSFWQKIIKFINQDSSMSREVIRMARGRPFKCPCGSSNNVSKGFRPTKTMGVRRLRRCKDCGRKFTPQNQKPLEAKDKNAGENDSRQVSKEQPMEAASSDESGIETSRGEQSANGPTV